LLLMERAAGACHDATSSATLHLNPLAAHLPKPNWLREGRIENEAGPTFTN
jgi:hypothetical protein